MPIYFANPGELPVAAITTLGVSVKEEGAIGYFGTGLKYAIATLLREGHRVKITTGGELHTFTSKPQVIRGATFQIVHRNDQPLGFTTALGKNWETWMAFRELHSNALDEGGTSSDRPLNGDTVIEVSGPAITKAYYERDTIFLNLPVIGSAAGFEISAGPSRHVYYRGVRIHELKRPSRFTYNITKAIYLTEDRTAKYGFQVDSVLEEGWVSSTDVELIKKVLTVSDYYEQDLTYSGEPTPAFLEACEHHAHEVNLNASARRLLEKSRPKEDSFKQVQLDRFESERLARACDTLKAIGVTIAPREITVVEALGDGVHAAQRDDKIYIAHSSFRENHAFLCHCVYEEWVHRDTGYHDGTRELQTYLFEKIIELAEQLERH